MNSTGGLSPSSKQASAPPSGSGGNSNKSASLTVINELPEAEPVTPTADNSRRSVGAASESADDHRASPTTLPPPPPPAGIFGDARPTLLGPADLLRLQRKHEKALRRANEKASTAAAEAKKRRKLKKQRKQREQSSYANNNNSNNSNNTEDAECLDEAAEDELEADRRRRRRQFPKASTCKSALVTMYYTTTILSAVSAAALLFVGLQYRVKGALIAGTLLAFSAFGLCTNHCFSQSLGVAKQLNPQEAAAANEERQILERSLSLVPQQVQQSQPDEATIQGERKKSTTLSVGVSETQQQQQQQQQQQHRKSVACAVDSILARRLSTLAVFPDPATRLMMRQQHLHHPQPLHQQRRSSMLHLARSMSLAAAAHHADPGWIGHPTAGMEDYTEFV